MHVVVGQQWPERNTLFPVLAPDVVSGHIGAKRRRELKCRIECDAAFRAIRDGGYY